MTRLTDWEHACDVAASDTIELYFYDELTRAERAAFDQHLTRCGDCRRALEDLGEIRAALDARPAVAAPPGGEWQTFMTRLDRAVARDRVAARGTGDAGTGTSDSIRPIAADSRIGSRIPDPGSRPAALTRPSSAGYIAMAALLTLVTINVALVVRARGTIAGTVPPAAVSQAGPRATDNVAAFEALSEEHFERSKLVVLGLATKDADHATAGDWRYERHLATSLLSDTRMYRLAAEDRGLQPLAGVLRDLELVLLQTSLTDETDPASLGQIQRLIGKRDLLQKMDAVATTGL